MNFPKLKNALLCRIMPYLVVVGGFVLPIILVVALPFIPGTIKGLVTVGLVIGLVAYIVKNFEVLMMMDLTLATIHCNNMARKRYDMPKGRDGDVIEKSLTSFGKPYEPIAFSPKPTTLRYKFSSSATVFSRGVERIVAVYRIESLNKEEYSAIIRSAKANSKALVGKKKALILDPQQKDAELQRVTVIVIIAKSIEEKLYNKLYETVSNDDGDEYDDAYIPCVVNLQNKTCIFNSLTIPNIGVGTPVKNRGIKLIKKYILGGNVQKNNRYLLDPLDNIDLDMTLWQFWSKMRKEIVDNDKEAQKRFENMKHKDIILEEDYLYLKWEDKGVWLSVEFDEEIKMAFVDNVDYWDYPKSNPIAKKTISDIKAHIFEYIAAQGYSCEFLEF